MRTALPYPPILADDSEAMLHLLATAPGGYRTFGFLTVDRTGGRVELRSRGCEVPKVLADWAAKLNGEAGDPQPTGGDDRGE